MAERYDNVTKTMAIMAVIFFVLLIILFFVLEFRYLKKIMVEYEDNIQRIVLNDINSFMHELQFYTDTAAGRIAADDYPSSDKFAELAEGNPRVADIKLLNESGRVLYSLRGRDAPQYPHADYRQARPGQPYSYAVKKPGQGMELCVASDMKTYSQSGGYLLVCYRINDLQQDLILKYATEKLKIALVDAEGSPLVWPFAGEVVESFKPDKESFSAAGMQYDVRRADLSGSDVSVLFFIKDSHFDTYRIIAIMILLFALYFLIYHFIVEFFSINNVNSYFDNIDFNIFNHLREGIIISNKAGRLVFANNVAHHIFDNKSISPGKTVLGDLIGPMEGTGGKVALKQSDRLLEIICSPIIKNGKLLGSLVVIGPDTEREKLCQNAMGKVLEQLPDGLVFVDREGKIISFNMMAECFLGQMKSGQKLVEVNTGLTALVEKNIGAAKMTRERLSWPDMFCELLPILDGSGLYAGTVIFLKNDTGYCQ